MTVTKMLLKSSAISLADIIEYPQTGVQRKILLEDANCQYALMSLAAETAIAEHLDQNYWAKFAHDFCACRNAEEESDPF